MGQQEMVCCGCPEMDGCEEDVIARVTYEHDIPAILAVPDMLLALREVLKTPGLQSGLQALCAAAVAKATGQGIDEVLAYI